MMRNGFKIPLIFAADIIHGHRTIFPVGVGEAASCRARVGRADGAHGSLRGGGHRVSTGLSRRWSTSPLGPALGPDDGRRWRGHPARRVIAQARVARVSGAATLTGRRRDAGLRKHIRPPMARPRPGSTTTRSTCQSALCVRSTCRPFKAAFDAGALSSMSSFNELSGVPAHASDWLLQTILRDEWDFEGFVVSDYTGDMEMIDHGYAADAREATKLAFLAGVDMSMTSGFYRDHLPGLVEAGEVPMERLDAPCGACWR